MKLNRREALKLTGVTLGGIALSGSHNSLESNLSIQGEPDPSQRNSLFEALPVFPSGEILDPNEMRITFLGTSCIPRLSQECNSIYVEVGSGDTFVFDCGSGVIAKYNAMGIRLSKMNKIFLTHLHGDHMSDLTHIYCFGPSQDRRSPLFVWGPSDSGFVYTDPLGNSRGPYSDGTRSFCEKFREMLRWHTESFSFGATSYPAYQSIKPTRQSWGLPADPVPVGNDSDDDAYAIIPVELDWQKSGITPGDNVAYHNQATGVKITHFPVIHCRRGSIGYKLEWKGLSMIFTGDTKPNYYLIEQAAGVDVLIHEMVMPAKIWAEKNTGLSEGQTGWSQAFNYAVQVQNSSHTPQGAFGYILSQISPPPRLTVATHFQAADDTIDSALKSVRAHYPVGEITFAADFMVLNVSSSAIRQRRAVVSPYAFYPLGAMYAPTNSPKYWKWSDDAHTAKVPDAFAQIDMSRAVPAINPVTKEVNYREDGY